MTIEKLSQLEACSNYPDDERWVSLNHARLYRDIRKELVKAELRGEQAAERRALELAAAEPKVITRMPADDGLRTDGAFGDYVVTRKQLAAMREEFEGKVRETRGSIENMRGVFVLHGKDNALALLKRIERLEANADASRNYQAAMQRIEDLERNLGPDLKNEVAQAQIAKYQGLGKRMRDAETQLDRQGEALNAHLRRLGKLEAHPERLGSSEKNADRRVEMLEAYIRGQGETIHALQRTVERLEEATGELKAWRSNVVKLEHVGALDERVSALEAAAVPPGPPEHRDLVALDKHFDGRCDALSKRLDAAEHGLQKHTHTTTIGTFEQAVSFPKMWGNVKAPGAIWVGGEPPTDEQIDEANSRGK